MIMSSVRNGSKKKSRPHTTFCFYSILPNAANTCGEGCSDGLGISY